MKRRAPASTPCSSKPSLIFFFFFLRKMSGVGRNWKQKMCNRAQSSPRKWAMALGSGGLMGPSAVALGVGPASLQGLIPGPGL